MMAGVRVIWPEADGYVNEKDYFYDIDVADLDHIPEFTTVQAFWPRYKGGAMGEYVVDAHCKRNGMGEVRLVVTYDRVNQTAEFLEQYGGLDLWGKLIIILQQGEQQGRCKWLSEGAKDWEKVKWEAFGSAPRLISARYRGSRREAGFRQMILACDDHRCVLTGEATTKALDAAHLIPAAMGENDVPSNGITLRADLHRLFDAGLFTFDHDGRVVAIARELSEAYRRLLQNRRLPPSSLERVEVTLALPQFQDRPCAP